jgi:hypothetical protein
MNPRYTFLISLAALLFCIWSSRGILEAWNAHSMYEKYSWILLCIWLIPFFYWGYILFRKNVRATHFPNQVLLACAVGFSFLGNIGEVHLLENIGFELAISAFIPISLTWIFWLFSGLAWMPQISWALTHIVPNHTSWYFVCRFLIISVCSLWLLLSLKYKE